MRVVLQVMCAALAAPVFAFDGDGGWVVEQCPTPIHVDRYTSNGGGGLGQSFADCGIAATCDEVEASGWGTSYLGSGSAAHQDAGNGWTYKAYRWTGEGHGLVRFVGRAHTNEGSIAALDGKASIALEVSVEIESSVTPVVFAEGHGRVSNFGPGGSIGAETQLPSGSPIPVTITANAATSAVAPTPHEIVIPEMIDQKIGQECMTTFDWQVQTHAASEVYVEWQWFNGNGYARGRILRGGNAMIELTLGGSCE